MTRADDVPPRSSPADAHGARTAAPPPVADGAVDASPPPPPVGAADASAPAPPIDGPHELPLEPGRPVYYALPGIADGGAPPRAGAPPWRLVGHLHGMCGAPSYACGKWLGAATDVGAIVCPTGNARCGDSPSGPPSWEAPSFGELIAAMDHDLESAIAKVSAKRPGAIRRDGAVLTGYSRGAYVAAPIARLHPGRWPYLVLIEANVPLSADGLRKAGVRAVALVAGERGAEIAGERKTAAALAEAGFPAKLFVMPSTGHLYSDDMERVMAEALAFVLAN